MEEGRTKTISNMKIDVEKQLESIMDTFKDFTDGMRMLLLMERKKDGGGNKEERRVFETYVTFNTDSFKEKLRNLLYLKQLSTNNLRIYSCLNARNMKKVIRTIEEGLLESHYTDDLNREMIHKKTCGGQRHYIMQTNNAVSKLFLLDIDDIENQDELGKALQIIQSNGINELLRYRTKNGWHIVTEPFNPALWSNAGGDPDQVKKDPLLLLSY